MWRFILMELIINSVLASIKSVASIALIVIPLMIVLQLANDYKVIDKLMKVFRPIGKFLGLSDGGAFTLLIGLIFGISYGSGVIIQSSKDGKLSENDKLLLVLFLIICHAVFEDTLLFAVIGANGLYMLTIRVALAVLITLGYRLFALKKTENLNID
jgi:hypothetical protein